ncbi:MAG: HlyC/CorC family transporter, partial [Caldilineales bacterium]|nr:HlyC/CorC family transporter [Caldilineales bacterium]
MTIAIEIAAIFLLIGINGVLAMSEIAILSARKVRLRQMADQGNRAAQTALDLATEPADFLSTVQVGITLLGILSGVFGGATLVLTLEHRLEQFPALARFSPQIALLIVVSAITYFSLVLGELSPKRYGLTHAERIAVRMAPSMRRLARLASPVVRLLSFSSSLVLRLLRMQPAADAAVTEDEIRAMIEQGTDAGVLEPIEEELVGRVFRLSDQRAQALLTPRTEIDWIDLDEPLAASLQAIAARPHVQYPVARGSLDSVVGVVRAQDLLATALAGQAIDLAAMLQPAIFVPETLPALDLLAQMRDRRSRIALVIDEYGGLEGLVTMTDVLEAIIGEFKALTPSEQEIVRLEDGSYLLDGMVATAELKELLGQRELPMEDERAYSSLGGMIMATMGRIPGI